MWHDFRVISRSNAPSEEAVTGVWAKNSAGWTKMVVVDRYEVFSSGHMLKVVAVNICWQMECLVLPGPDLL